MVKTCIPATYFLYIVSLYYCRPPASVIWMRCSIAGGSCGMNAPGKLLVETNQAAAAAAAAIANARQCKCKAASLSCLIRTILSSSTHYPNWKGCNKARMTLSVSCLRAHTRNLGTFACKFHRCPWLSTAKAGIPRYVPGTVPLQAFDACKIPSYMLAIRVPCQFQVLACEN